MNKTYVLLLSVLFFGTVATGCGKDKQDGAARPDTVQVPAPVMEATPDRVFNVMATVTEVDKEKNRLFIDHEKMEGYMEAMVMPFRVANPTVFEKVSVGTRGKFTIEVKGDMMGVITDVQVEPKQ